MKREGDGWMEGAIKTNGKGQNEERMNNDLFQLFESFFHHFMIYICMFHVMQCEINVDGVHIFHFSSDYEFLIDISRIRTFRCSSRA